MNISPDQLKALTISEGWSNFGIIPIDQLQVALNKHEGVFEKWIEKSYHAEMEYLKRMQGDRFHPKNKLPDIKSVIVLLATYSSNGERMGDELGTDGLRIGDELGTDGLRIESDASGLVARYARGRDYHKVLKKRLIRLSKWLKEQDEGVETYLSVDSGPTVDRVLAETAGLGFFGKNSLIIDPRKGSYFFIASLMVNRALPVTPKTRLPNCGDCRKCISACPTDAIVAPGVIDARRCISYLTIENKGGIPVEFRSKLGNRLFGCDICQEVCPFNEGRAHHQKVMIGPLKEESGIGSRLNLKEILSIKTDEQFLEKFAGTPLMRAKRRGLIRNACVVAGNSGDVSLIPYLQNVVEREGDEMLKEHARWGIEVLKKR